jgi:hypothetical protein
VTLTQAVKESRGYLLGELGTVDGLATASIATGEVCKSRIKEKKVNVFISAILQCRLVRSPRLPPKKFKNQKKIKKGSFHVCELLHLPPPIPIGRKMFDSCMEQRKGR